MALGARAAQRKLSSGQGERRIRDAPVMVASGWPHYQTISEAKHGPHSKRDKVTAEGVEDATGNR